MKMTKKQKPSNIILHKNRYNESTGKIFSIKWSHQVHCVVGFTTNNSAYICKKKLIQCGYIYACILCSFGGLIPVANGKKSHEFFKGKIFTPGVIICTSLSE